MGEVMTKTEFSEQFKRLRVAGYRLPVFQPGESVSDLTAEWYGTFGACTKDEFAYAIDELKKAKTDTWWPAPGELWAHVFEYRKGRRLRLQQQMPGDDGDGLTPAQRQELAAHFRDFARRLSAKMAMPKVSEGLARQDVPDEVLQEIEEREAMHDKEETA
jgi:hypothetical protein